MQAWHSDLRRPWTRSAGSTLSFLCSTVCPLPISLSPCLLLVSPSHFPPPSPPGFQKPSLPLSPLSPLSSPASTCAAPVPPSCSRSFIFLFRPDCGLGGTPKRLGVCRWRPRRRGDCPIDWTEPGLGGRRVLEWAGCGRLGLARMGLHGMHALACAGQMLPMGCGLRVGGGQAGTAHGTRHPVCTFVPPGIHAVHTSKMGSHSAAERGTRGGRDGIDGITAWAEQTDGNRCVIAVR